MKLVKPTDPLVVKSRVKSIMNSLKRTTRCNVGIISIDEDMRGIFAVSFENDGLLAEDMRDLLEKIRGFVFIHTEEFEGHYDWAADTFFRPVSVVTYKVK